MSEDFLIVQKESDYTKAADLGMSVTNVVMDIVYKKDKEIERQAARIAELEGVLKRAYDILKEWEENGSLAGGDLEILCIIGAELDGVK